MSSRKYSKDLVDGPNQAASRSMLRGVGFTSEDFSKSIVGITNILNALTIVLDSNLINPVKIISFSNECFLIVFFSIFCIF